jgi:DNA-binding MarR family transcriptional regulator
MPNIKLANLYQFWSELLEHWIPLVTGGLCIAGVAIWEHFTQRSISWGLFALVVLVSFGRANYQVWRKKQEEVANLKKRPYDQERLEVAKGILSQLFLVERDILRYLMRHQGAPTHLLNAASEIGQDAIAVSIRSLEQKDLITRVEDHNLGRVYLNVKEKWVSLFEDLLFPRDEQQPPIVRMV